jgi:hypothetical protein
MKIRVLLHGVLTLYLAGLLAAWFLSTDYLGTVPDNFAREVGLTDVQHALRNQFYRDYIF